MSKFKFNTIEKLENAKTQLETIKRGIISLDDDLLDLKKLLSTVI